MRACPMNKKLSREIMLLANGLLQSCMLRETLKLYAVRNLWMSMGISAEAHEVLGQGK